MFGFEGPSIEDQQMTAERPEMFSIQSLDGICTRSVNSTSSLGPGKQWSCRSGSYSSPKKTHESSPIESQIYLLLLPMGYHRNDLLLVLLVKNIDYQLLDHGLTLVVDPLVWICQSLDHFVGFDIPNRQKMNEQIF